MLPTAIPIRRNIKISQITKFRISEFPHITLIQNILNELFQVVPMDIPAPSNMPLIIPCTLASVPFGAIRLANNVIAV